MYTYVYIYIYIHSYPIFLRFLSQSMTRAPLRLRIYGALLYHQLPLAGRRLEPQKSPWFHRQKIGDLMAQNIDSSDVSQMLVIQRSVGDFTMHRRKLHLEILWVKKKRKPGKTTILWGSNESISWDWDIKPYNNIVFGLTTVELCC